MGELLFPVFPQECSGKLWIKFSSSERRTRTFRLVEYHSCDWLTCRSQVIMLTVDSEEERRRRRRVKTTNKMFHKTARCFFNSQQTSWNHLTTLETNETLFEAIAFLLEIRLAVGCFCCCCLFPFPIKRKYKFSTAMDSVQTGENRVLGLFFPHYCSRHRL